MNKPSVLRKILIAMCSVMAIVLLVSGLIAFHTERQQQQAMTAKYQMDIERSITTREQSEKLTLRENVAFNTRVLSRISAGHLYNIDPYSLKEALRPYLEYPEIVAIQVMNEHGAPFAAAWKSPHIQEGEKLPENLALNAALSVEVEALQEEELVGKVRVFYTETIVNEKIEQARQLAVQELADVQAAATDRLRATIRHRLIEGICILATFALCLGIALRLFIFKPVAQVSEIAQQLSQLNLQVGLETTRNDEVGRLFQAINAMIQSFQQVIAQVQRSGIQITSSSTELAATARQQEATMKTQVEASNQVLGTLEEIVQVNDHLVRTMQDVASSDEQASASRQSTDLMRMASAMQQMEAASRAISGRLQSINEKADNITAIVTTITKVADQTNLLSLNAAIEAEKAGEYGRGFTVVAREIRRLADQTAVATLDIERMVGEMQSAVTSGVMEMDKFIAEVQTSAEDVQQIGAKLSDLIQQVQSLSPRFEDVNQSMTDLNEGLRQTAESLSETFQAIGQLNEAAKGLQNEVTRFKLT